MMLFYTIFPGLVVSLIAIIVISLTLSYLKRIAVALEKIADQSVRESIK